MMSTPWTSRRQLNVRCHKHVTEHIKHVGSRLTMKKTCAELTDHWNWQLRSADMSTDTSAITRPWNYQSLTISSQACSLLPLDRSQRSVVLQTPRNWRLSEQTSATFQLGSSNPLFCLSRRQTQNQWRQLSAAVQTVTHCAGLSRAWKPSVWMRWRENMLSIVTVSRQQQQLSIVRRAYHSKWTLCHGRYLLR